MLPLWLNPSTSSTAVTAKLKILPCPGTGSGLGSGSGSGSGFGSGEPPFLTSRVTTEAPKLFPSRETVASVVFLAEFSPFGIRLCVSLKTAVRSNPKVCPADDQIWNFVEGFIAGRVSRAAFWELVKFNYPTHQIVFCTEKALKTLVFEGSDTL